MDGMDGTACFFRTKSIFDFSENFITYGALVEMNTREKSFEKFDVIRPLLQVLMSYVRDGAGFLDFSEILSMIQTKP